MIHAIITSKAEFFRQRNKIIESMKHKEHYSLQKHSQTLRKELPHNSGTPSPQQIHYKHQEDPKTRTTPNPTGYQ